MRWSMAGEALSGLIRHSPSHADSCIERFRKVSDVKKLDSFPRAFPPCSPPLLTCTPPSPRTSPPPPAPSPRPESEVSRLRFRLRQTSARQVASAFASLRRDRSARLRFPPTSASGVASRRKHEMKSAAHSRRLVRIKGAQAASSKATETRKPNGFKIYCNVASVGLPCLERIL